MRVCSSKYRSWRIVRKVHAERVTDTDAGLEAGILDIVRFGVEDINKVVIVYGERHSAGHPELVPLRDELSLLIENLNSSIASIANEQTASLIHIDAMHR